MCLCHSPVGGNPDKPDYFAWLREEVEQRIGWKKIKTGRTGRGLAEPDFVPLIPQCSVKQSGV